MYKTKTSNGKKRSLWFVGLISILLPLCISIVFANKPTPKTKDVGRSKTILDRAAPATRRDILSAATRAFEPSLEMKENVDFLLTPALLVQEVMSTDIVITYPSE